MSRYAAVCLAVALLLAGCVGGQGGTTTSPAPGDAETTTVAETTEVAGTTAGGGATGGGETTSDASAVNFYLSDERNAMGDFEHLNVTVSKVGMKRADGKWTNYDVDNRTVDLTTLTGANATRLGTFDASNGTYDTVFVHIAEVNGTLTNGEQVRVKLPSQKLQIHQSFTVGANQSVDYVFDTSVFKAGKSGKYILKPVISESGTDKKIESVDDEDDKNEREEREGDEDAKDDEKAEKDDETTADDEAALNATFVGNVTRGENATVSVAQNGSAAANATVAVNGETVGRTAADGTLTFAVPDADELEVEIETENGSAKLETEFESGDDGTGSGETGNGERGDGGN
ncbi:DUF4382 domain-containing protein [Halorussus limi]|uniref:DUF4382 domain-containing protein n=1 Tax=Halorussus limi TaxID=2938695 RepID=A0A8U0HWI2_9EURY|nr:DUF4382 domain-containing protein [Halorussus limi]UPV75440.1 DUF4382 domain-containing protein [Halorussus limi]